MTASAATRLACTLCVALAVTVAAREHSTHHAESSGHEKVFSYINTEVWDGKCKTGRFQSPVFIQTDALPTITSDPLKAKLNDFGMISDAKIFHTGTTIEVNWENWLRRPNLTIPAVNGNPLAVFHPEDLSSGCGELKVTPFQFHFHVPGENALDGKWSSGEVHIVSKVDEGQSEYCDKMESGCLVVYGILLEHDQGIGRKSEVLDQFLSVLPLERTGEKHGTELDFNFDLNGLHPEDKSFITFPGSLTTPPCTEGIIWVLMRNPVQVSVAQIEKIERNMALTPGPDCLQPKHLPDEIKLTDQQLDRLLRTITKCPVPRQTRNNRPPQPLHGRFVGLVSDES